jgi:hypothetical protein
MIAGSDRCLSLFEAIRGRRTYATPVRQPRRCCLAWGAKAEPPVPSVRRLCCVVNDMLRVQTEAAPISPVANPCCNVALKIGVVLSR